MYGTMETISHRSRDDLRVRIVVDESADEPYDDGGSPILHIEHKNWGRYSAGQDGPGRPLSDYTGMRLGHRILEAAERWGDDLSKLERYLRICHGVTKVEVRDHPIRGGGTFVTFDLAEWREKNGAPEGSANMDEWIAYLEGECYAWMMERRLTRTSPDGLDEWKVVDSCWGYYGEDGYKFARAEAQKELNWAAENSE